MPFTKIDIRSRNKVDIKNNYLCFSMLQFKRSRDKRMFFFCFFCNQISFLFSFSCTCLMGTFKNTEYNKICKVFSEVFLITRIPYSAVLITEAVVQRCSVKKVFLKFSQNSQGNMCARASFFNKVADLSKFLRKHIVIVHLWWLIL